VGIDRPPDVAALHPGYAFFASAAAQFDVAPIERNPYDAAP